MLANIFNLTIRTWLLIGLIFLGLTTISSAKPASSFTLFESGQVRPLALSPNGNYLFAVNTPDNRLEIFRVSKHGLNPIGSVAVGLEPVAVAVHSNTEVWVVNHLSDSVSVIDFQNGQVPRVVRTLLVGDEPRDIVFAGPNKNRAFITTAHRGQNSKIDPQLTTPSVGRADVWVFDADHLGSSLEGDALTILTLFSDTPRALAATPDGSKVYAAGFQTGNRTATINEFLLRQNTKPLNPDAKRFYPGPQSNLLGGGPLINHANVTQPTVGLIVKFEVRPNTDAINPHWYDELNQIWDDLIPFTLPDKDVFTIDAMANPPKALANGEYSGVGTVLFNMIVNPVNQHVYVTNTEAQNQNRFEGAGIFSQGQTVRGHLHENRITVLDDVGHVLPRHLNKHIDYSQCCAPIPNQENSTSVAFPLDMAISSDGASLYVTMFGTSEIAFYKTNQLEDDSFVPDEANQIHVSGGGPSGIVLDESRSRAYVLTRFDNAISIIDTRKSKEIRHLAMYNPEPQPIVEGRRFLYDASFTSSHGDSACASCHVFGDFDSLAWDLGDPDHDETLNTGPFRLDEKVGFFLSRAIAVDPQTGQVKLLDNPINPDFRPMKGPMTTQSLRGLDNHGSMHWRGDRTGGNDDNLLPNAGPNSQPNGGSFNEEVAFRKFNVAFGGLNGRSGPLSDKDMKAFTDFMLEVTYPPNPIRNLDNSLTNQQQVGRNFYCGLDPLVCNAGNPSDTFHACNGCHVLDRAGNREFPEVKKPGFFGTDGQFSFEGNSQLFKVPHLRNLYQKVGMFGMQPNPPFPPPTEIAPSGSLIFFPLANTPLPANAKEQVRGFGFLHDGSVDTVFRFLSSLVFAQRPSNPNFGIDPRTPKELLIDGKDPGNLGGLPLTAEGILLRRQIESFLLAFDSNLAPIVGQQVTLTRENSAAVNDRIGLLIARADAHECDLVAKNRWSGYLYAGNGRFRSSHSKTPTISDQMLRTSARLPKGEITFTCTPPGSGRRIGIDRDEDGILDNNDPNTN